ncbi:unnamed protein product, partial [Rotaria magnacalcarata]
MPVILGVHGVDHLSSNERSSNS